MSTARPPLVLLPPSKGKAPGGDGPRFDEVLAVGHPLDAHRRRVVDHLLADLPELDDRGVARVAGVASSTSAATRHLLEVLPDAPTSPAHRRYTGIVHGNAGLAELDPTTTTTDVRIVSALLGLVALDEPVPDYRLEFATSLPSLGGLATFWRTAVADHLAELGADRRVWDLLPGEHRRIWDPAVRDGLPGRIEVAFLRPDGRPANAARTKVAKGRLAAALIADAELTPAAVHRHVDLGPGWTVTVAGTQVTATYGGP